MIQRMLIKAKEIHDNDLVVKQYETDSGIRAVIQSYAVFDYLKSVLGSEYAICSDVLCAADFGVPQKRQRFIVIGIRKSISEFASLPSGILKPEEYHTVRDAIGDLESVKPIINVKDDYGIPIPKSDSIDGFEYDLRNSGMLYNHIITNTGKTAMERFCSLKQGENFHSLDTLLKATYTDVSRTQNTVYLRLNYDKPSGTVVNVRKSMWIHPTQNRAISIREAARLQTFPDDFIFYGTKDQQYQQVGNAVPPMFAKAIATALFEQLKSE